MKQGNKIVSCVVLLSMLLVMIQTVSLFGLLQAAFKNVEKYLAGKNLQFCVNSLQAELKHLDEICFEWSAWDDTGHYIQEKKPQYIGENMTESTLREKKLDVICILDTKGNLIWSRCVKNSAGQVQAIDMEMFKQENLHKNTSLWTHTSVNDCVSGFAATEGGVLMLSSRPVTNNTNSPPIHGTIVVGRFITDQIIASIASQTCLDFKWWNLHSEYTKKAVARYTSNITPDSPVYIEFEINSAAAYTILTDIHKNDAVLVKFLLTDELAVYREQIMIKSAGLYFLEGILFLVCLAVMISRYCRKQMPPQTQTADLPSEFDSLSFEQVPNVRNSGIETGQTEKPVDSII